MRVSIPPPSVSPRLLEQFRLGLGMPLGPLMSALVTLHDEEAVAFATTLDCVLDPGIERIEGMTPDGVVPFAETSDGEQFGLLATGDPAESTDGRPVCRVGLAKGSPTTHVIAADLADFLSLLAYAGSYEIGRDEDEDYRRTREALLDDTGHRENLLRVSARLCELPGVALPSRPSTIRPPPPAG
jgi:hypothetical protein